MAAEPDEVIFESPLLKLRGTSKRIVKFGSSNSWQEKYFVLQKHRDVPFLVYYNKKPKNKNAIPRGKICLKPSFRVEKSMNAKNRAYVFEVTTPVRHLCLSADEQKVMDLFVFFLQIQVKLSSDIIDDFFIVQPENSEAHRRIGARGTCCMFHIAPWGVTLALQNSRAVLAQWPLKSIRCYESNGNGQFILEAGRIAPMGDGVYVFNTRSQDDNAMYDLLDKYVLSATAALRGHHPNNQEQYNDLQLERDRLNALTSVTSDLCLNSELSQATIQNYNYRLQGFTQLPNTPQPTPDLVNRALPNEEYLDSRGYLHPTSSVRQPPLSNDRPPPIALTNEMFGVRSRQDPNRNNLDFKPPPVVSLPKSSEISSSPSKYSLAKSQSYDESSVGASVNGDSFDGYLDMRQSTDSLDLVSSRVVSATPKSPAHTDWFPPPSFSEATRVSAGSYAGLKVTPSGQSLRKGEKMRQVSPSMKVILPSVTSTWSKSSGVHTPGTPSGSVSGAFTVGPVLPAEDTSYLNPRASEPDPSLPSSKGKAKPPVAPRGKIKGLESPATTPRPRHRMMRLKSRSAEDVSDFQKGVYANTEQSVEHSSSDTYMHSGKTTPEPFTDMGPFKNKSHSPDVRERGRRFLKNEKSQSAALESGTMPASHLRRHSQTRQQNLRRSVSNPNFWDHETKDIITKREKTYKNYSYGTPSLGKSTARSLASLLPGALKRHLSRENNASNYDDWNEGSSRSRSGSNDFRPRSSSFTKSASDIPSSNFTREFRRSSYGSKDSLSTSFKGIRMSEKSRSFRKQKSVTSMMSRQASEVSGAGSISPTGTESGAGTPSINGHGSPVMSPTFDTNSLRKKNLMAGRRLPSLPDEKEKKRESAC